MIVPGSANPLLMAQSGDPLDDLGKIERSVRFRDSVAASFSRVFPVAGNRVKWAVRVLVKRSKLSAPQFLLGVDQGGGNCDRVAFQSSDAIEYNNGATGTQAVVTPGRYRDPSAWADVLVHYDSGNATQADRAIVFIDGARVSGAGLFLLNQLSSINAAGVNHSIGGIFPFGGYLAHFCFFDDVLPPTSVFGKVHQRTGQWRSYGKGVLRANVAALGGPRNGWGANGCFLPFDDTTSLTTLGYDRSQSDTGTAGNNWTAVNISLTAGATYDSMLDTPTNNFPVMNPLLPINVLTGGYYPILPTDGSLKVTGSSSPPANYQVGTQQINFTTGYAMLVGNVGSGTFYIGIQSVSSGQTYVYQQDGQKNLAGVASAYGAAFTVGDRIAVVIDPVARTLEFFKQPGAVGSVVSQGVIATAFPAGDYVPFFYASNGTVLTVDFGQQGFLPSSLSADAKVLCTKNLPINLRVMKSTDAFVAKTNSGANIIADLSAAAPWSDWIHIYKRRYAAEGWRWQFSDDPGNYLDSSSIAAKTAFPALAGAAYIGYALRVSPRNGVATGIVAHINGIADVVTDGLANNRKMVILKNEATGNWIVYHPDLTSGKLLYLNSNLNETTDDSITAVAGSSFTLAADLPSGTYRWIALAEVDQFLKLGKYTGNGSVDGTFVQSFGSALRISKRYNATGYGWFDFDSVRNPSNPATAMLYPNADNAEETLADSLVDNASNGFKYRQTNAGLNGTSGLYVFLEFSAFPFRYANAR